MSESDATLRNRAGGAASASPVDKPTATSTGSSTSTSQNPPPTKSLTPFYLVLLSFAAFAYQLGSSHIASLKAAEANWDPMPKGMGKNEIIILYCAG